MAARINHPVHGTNPSLRSEGGGRATSVGISEFLDRWTQDLIKQGEARQQADALAYLDSLRKNLKTEGFKHGEKQHEARQLQQMVAEFQRERGLPATGGLDAKTVAALKESNLAPTAPSAPVVSSQKTEGQEQAGKGRTRVDAEVQQETRVMRQAAEKEVKARVEANEKPARELFDPERMLASLLNAGFKGPGGKQGLEDALRSFQAAFGLPVTGTPDSKTMDALKREGVHVVEDASKAQAQKDAPEQKSAVRRALHDASTTAKQVDKQPERDLLRPQAQTKDAHKSADVAARAAANEAHPVPERVRSPAEQMRTDSALADQVARERGVQEGRGDPKAVEGRSDTKGEGQGLSGKGGEGGGAGEALGTGSLVLHGPEGDESAAGTGKAGDDDFHDVRRGHASVGDDDEGQGGGHYQVGSLGEQVRAALESIARDDDGKGPITYTWDVTIYRPGIYSAHQPAEPLWHLRVEKKTAFDPIWQEARDALVSRILYLEPDSDPPTEEDFVLALRRARVRDPVVAPA